MREKNQTSHAEEFQIMYTDLPASRRESRTPYSSCVRLHRVASFKVCSLEVGSNCTVENPTPPGEVTKPITAVITHADSMYTWYDVMKWYFASMAFLPQIHNPNIIMNKTSNTFHWWVSYKISDKSPQSSQGHVYKETLWNAHIQEKPKETIQLNVMWHPSWDPGTEEQHLVKTKEIWINYTLVIIFLY